MHHQAPVILVEKTLNVMNVVDVVGTDASNVSAKM